MSFNKRIAPAKIRMERIKTKKSANPSKSLTIRIWMFYILTMLWVMRNTLFIRQRDNYAAIDTLAMFQILFVAMILALFFITPMADFWKQVKNSSVKFFLIYFILGAASALWSINPTYSLYRSAEAFALSTAILFFCTSAETPEEAVRRVQLIIWPTLLTSWAGLILMMGFSMKYRLNGFGATAAMTSCFIAALILAERENLNKKLLLQLGLGFFLLIISWSLASWWSFWFGIFYCLMFTRRKALAMVLVLVGLTLFFSLDQGTRTSLLIRDKQYENLSSMTGRQVLWIDYMGASKKRPLLGYGYGMGARRVGKIYTTNCHNVFFGALMGVGWVGVIILGCFLIILIKELLGYQHFRNPAWLAGGTVLAAGWLNTMSLSILGENFTAATTIFVAVLGLHLFFIKQEKQARLEKKKSTQPRIKKTLSHK